MDIKTFKVVGVTVHARHGPTGHQHDFHVEVVMAMAKKDEWIELSIEQGLLMGQLRRISTDGMATDFGNMNIKEIAEKALSFDIRIVEARVYERYPFAGVIARKA